MTYVEQQELDGLLDRYKGAGGLGISDYSRLTTLLVKENEELRKQIAFGTPTDGEEAPKIKQSA